MPDPPPQHSHLRLLRGDSGPSIPPALRVRRSTSCSIGSASTPRARWPNAPADWNCRSPKLEAAISALELALVTERRRTIELSNPLKNVN